MWTLGEDVQFSIQIKLYELPHGDVQMWCIPEAEELVKN